MYTEGGEEGPTALRTYTVHMQEGGVAVRLGADSVHDAVQYCGKLGRDGKNKILLKCRC